MQLSPGNWWQPKRGSAQETARILPWIGTGDSLHERRLRDEQRDRMQRIQNFQLGGPEKPMNGGLADRWYLDDGDLLSRPLLVLAVYKPSTKQTENRSPSSLRFHGCSWERHTGSCCGAALVFCGPAPGESRRHPRSA